MSRLILLLTFMSFLLLLPHASAYQLGVSPSVINVGELDRGSSRVLHFFVTTQSTDDLVVSLSTENVGLDYLKKPDYAKLMQNYSEQDASSWIEFINNPITLEYSPIDKNDGNINRWRKVNFILKIPEDAEPGYHAVSLTPSPKIPAGYGTTFNIVSLASVVILVNVPGNALRSGKILDIASGGYLGERLRVNTIFQNTGTVTMNIKADNVNIYDENGDAIHTLGTVFGVSKPGEITELGITFKPEMGPGEYSADATVYFETGKEFKEATIYVGQPTVTLNEPEPPKPIIPNFGFEWLLIPLIIIIAFLIYRRGSD